MVSSVQTQLVSCLPHLKVCFSSLMSPVLFWSLTTFVSLSLSLFLPVITPNVFQLCLMVSSHLVYTVNTLNLPQCPLPVCLHLFSSWVFLVGFDLLFALLTMFLPLDLDTSPSALCNCCTINLVNFYKWAVRPWAQTLFLALIAWVLCWQLAEADLYVDLINDLCIKLSLTHLHILNHVISSEELENSPIVWQPLHTQLSSGSSNKWKLGWRTAELLVGKLLNQSKHVSSLKLVEKIFTI